MVDRIDTGTGDAHGATIGGKPVTVVTNLPMRHPSGWHFVYVHGDIVFAVVIFKYDLVFEPPPDDVPAFVAEALKKLP